MKAHNIQPRFSGLLITRHSGWGPKPSRQPLRKGEPIMTTATEAKHTPGPWKLLPIHCWEYQVGAPGQGDYAGQTAALAVVRNWDCQPPGEQVYANARLIAAAPELLEACRKLINIVHSGPTQCPFGVPMTPKNNPCECNYHDDYRSACSVIAKAEGRE